MGEVVGENVGARGGIVVGGGVGPSGAPLVHVAASKAVQEGEENDVLY